MEEAPFRETTQKNTQKETLVTLTERDSLILEAAIEFGSEYFYDIKNGTLGLTLYIKAPNKIEASYIRQKAPSFWRELYVIVLYNSTPDFEEATL